MHLKENAKANFIALTVKSLAKFHDCAIGWCQFDCKEAEIARISAQKIGLTLGDPDCVIELHPHIGYHYDCYKRFCDISKIKRLEKRAEIEKRTTGMC